MYKLIFAVLISVAASTAIYAQDTTSEAKPTQVKQERSTITISEAKKAPTAPVKADEKRAPVFRPTKDQIKQVQAMLKTKLLYDGEATGTYNEETRSGIRKFQKENGLRSTGTLNRATLEKMNITLTDGQKAIPVSESSFAKAEAESKPEKAQKSGPSDAEPKAKKPAVFRATADQIKEAQKMLKAKSMYAGSETGRLDDDTRTGLKKYQEANKLKVTGTLNQTTLESMGIALTDKQKGSTPAEQK